MLRFCVQYSIYVKAVTFAPRIGFDSGLESASLDSKLTSNGRYQPRTGMVATNFGFGTNPAT